MLGIPAEAPVFVSPDIKASSLCSECGVVYTPLIYQAGYTIEAQHFHEKQGGIYFHDEKESLLSSTSALFHKERCFIAEVLPQKLVLPDGNPIFNTYRSPAVSVQSIHAFCYRYPCQTYYKEVSAHEIQKGFIVKEFATGTLVPVCGEEFSSASQTAALQQMRIKKTNVAYEFRITREGEVQFSPSERNYINGFGFHAGGF